MAKLTMAQRRKIPKSDFAVPSKAPGPGSYPIKDPKHARIALGLAGMHGSSATKARVRAKVKAKFPSIGKKSSTRNTGKNLLGGRG